MALIKCPGCEKDISDKAEKCIHCGYLLKVSSGTDSLATSKAPVKSEQNICSKCGAVLNADQSFCPKCGQRAGLAVDDSVSMAINQFNAGIENKKKKKSRIPIIAVVAVIAVLALVIYLKGHSVEDIQLSKDSIKIKVDESETVGYTIFPDKARGAKVTWSSSNESVAKVDDDGRITGKGDGTCTITASAGKEKDSITVTVKAGPDLVSIYRKYCNSTWATVGSDGSYLSIDTNPSNKDDYTDYEALEAILVVNDALGLPDSLEESFGKTTAMMGRQSETFSDIGITVSWSYHPDNGLDVSYKLID